MSEDSVLTEEAEKVQPRAVKTLFADIVEKQNKALKKRTKKEQGDEAPGVVRWGIM